MAKISDTPYSTWLHDVQKDQRRNLLEIEVNLKALITFDNQSQKCQF